MPSLLTRDCGLAERIASGHERSGETLTDAVRPLRTLYTQSFYITIHQIRLISSLGWTTQNTLA